MALTLTPLTSGSAGTGSSAQTDSITPTADRLIILVVSSVVSASPNVPTASGNGLTWVQMATVQPFSNRRLTMFRAMGGAPTPGQITIDFGGQSQNGGIAWSVSEIAGVKPGTNGINAVRQVTTGTGSSSPYLVNLASFDDENNGAFGAFSVSIGFQAIAPGAGFTEIHEVLNSNISFQTEWRADNDVTVDASGFSQSWGGIAFEIVAELPVIQGSAALIGTATIAAAGRVTGPVRASASLIATASIQAVARKVSSGPTSIAVIGLGADTFAPGYDAIIRQEDSGALMRSVDPVLAQPTGGYHRLVRSEQQALTFPLYVVLQTGTLQDLALMASPGRTTTLLVDVGGERRTLRVMVTGVHPNATSPGLAVITLQSGDPRWESENAASVSKQFPGTALAVQQDGSAIEDRAVYTIRPDTLKAQADSYRYYREVLFLNRSGGTFPASWAHCITWDTAAEVTAGRMLASGNDVRILLDGVEVPRWADNWNNAASHIWFRSGLAPERSAKLRANITAVSPADDEALEVAPGGTTGWPNSGAIVFEDSLGVVSEVVTYDGIGESPDGIEAFLNIKRAQRGTAAAAHTTADTLWWQEHRVQVLYGWSNASAPDPHDELKPVNELSSPDVLIWDAAILDSEEPARSMQWKPFVFDRNKRSHQMLMNLTTPGPQPDIVFEHDEIGSQATKPNFNALRFTLPWGTTQFSIDWDTIGPYMALQVFGYDEDGNEVTPTDGLLIGASTLSGPGSYALSVSNVSPLRSIVIYSLSLLVKSTQPPYSNTQAVNPSTSAAQIVTLPGAESGKRTRIHGVGFRSGSSFGTLSIDLVADDEGSPNPTPLAGKILQTPVSGYNWMALDSPTQPAVVSPGQKVHLKITNTHATEVFQWQLSQNDFDGAVPALSTFILSADLDIEDGLEAPNPSQVPNITRINRLSITPFEGAAVLALQQQQDAYWLSGTLTVGGNSVELAILARVSDEIEIDATQRLVWNKTTGERLVSGAEFSDPAAWLPLPPGVTQVSYTEPGLVAATVTVQYHHRWEVLA